MRACRGLCCIVSILLVPNALRADEATSKRLHDIFKEEWDWHLKSFPDVSTILGFKRHNAEWPDFSPRAFAERNKHRLAVLEKLRTIDEEKLEEPDRLWYTIFRKEHEAEVESYKIGMHLFAINHREGIHDLSSVVDSLQLETARDYEDWIARLTKLPAYVEQTIALLQEGIDSNRVQTKASIQRIPAQLRRLLVDDPEKSGLFKPFRKFTESIAAAERERLTKAGKDAIAQHVVPAYRKLLDFVETKYLPACYEGVGVWRLHGGDAVYDFAVRQHTTTRLKPDEIHEIGLREVKRIRAEMESVIAGVGFKGTFAEFVAELRANPKFYFKTGDEIMTATKAICDKVEAELPKLFGKLPKTRFLLQPIPPALAPDTTSAYYMWPSADGRRPGAYYVNLYKPESRPKYQMEALSLHEAVPGHHLQIALAFEMEGVPAFRRYTFGYNAFVEGWALYSESLGERLGMYKDPYSKFGAQSYEIWRAVRLVVDTGMHAKKWSRAQAIEFAAANSASSQLDIENEIDRFAAWPGQALAYKIGELKIKELRKRAEAAFGGAFDIKAFHDLILSSGAVPLDVLESKVDRWIARRLSK